MLDTFIDLLGRPRGPLAPVLLSLMNIGHKPFIESVLSEIPIERSYTVLDIGCGGGIAIARMADRAQKVYGIDISPASVKKASSKNRKQIQSGRVSIMEGDVASLPFEDDTFDLVTAFETIYFWKDLELCFAAINRKLKPGGTFLAACEAMRKSNGEKTPMRKSQRAKCGPIPWRRFIPPWPARVSFPCGVFVPKRRNGCVSAAREKRKARSLRIKRSVCLGARPNQRMPAIVSIATATGAPDHPQPEYNENKPAPAAYLSTCRFIGMKQRPGGK